MNSELSNAIDQLTEMQAKAVDWKEGSLFLLAGPGSGKTRVLTTRIAKLLSDSPDKAFRIMALTFTNKAADEMSTRVANLVPEQERRALIGTFHSFCMQVLQQHGSHIGINPDFAIYSLEPDRQDILRDAIRVAGLDQEDSRYLKVIDKLKSKLVEPEGCSSRFKNPQVGKRVEETFKAYEKQLSKANALDFGSLIAQAYRLITKFPNIASRYQKSYKYWMFDEFQDTTDGQYRLIKALAGESFRNIFAVADDDQIIYQWNGASYQQIQRFRTDFEPKELQLPTNFRCPPSIVAAANNLVVNNKQRTLYKQQLGSGKTNLRYPESQHIHVLRYSSGDEEAKGIAARIAETDKSDWGEVAILGRTRSLLSQIKNELDRAGVDSAIAQRRDDFQSPEFQFLSASLRQILRPLDRRAFENLVGAFNRWFDTAIQFDELFASAEISSRSFLDEWNESVKASQISEAIKIANYTIDCSKNPSRFHKYIKSFLDCIPQEDDETSDVAEDRAAWKELVRSIRKTVGADCPLEQFLQELALRSKEPPVAMNSISLMTVHAAKGKEFDHVYVAGLAEGVLPSFQSLKNGETSAEMEEERRNCFVAITRAKEWLCLTYADEYRGWSKKPSRFLAEMDVELPDSPLSLD